MSNEVSVESTETTNKEIKKLRARLHKKQEEIEQANRMYHLANSLQSRADEVFKANVTLQAQYADAIAEIKRLQEQTARIQQNYAALLHFRHADTAKHYKDLCEELKPHFTELGISEETGGKLVDLFGKGFFQMEVYELQSRMVNVGTGEPLVKPEEPIEAPYNVG